VPYGSLYILFSRHARCVVREYLPWICIAKILQLANLINSTKLIYETIYYRRNVFTFVFFVVDHKELDLQCEFVLIVERLCGNLFFYVF
jgi:hypothetical protein